MDADGENPRRLTKHAAWAASPSWSPDSQKIAFASMQNGTKNSEIYVINVDGRNLRNLTDHPAWDTHPSWAPDGQKIAFVSKRAGNVEIYVMDADGRNLRRLTNQPAADDQPDWLSAPYSASPTAKNATIWGKLKQNGQP